MKQKRQIQKHFQIFAAGDMRRMRQSHPLALYGALAMKRRKTEKKLEALLSTAKHEFQIHLRLQTDEPEWSFSLLSPEGLTHLIGRVQIPLTGHTKLEGLAWLQEEACSLCEGAEILRRLSRHRHTFEGFRFGGNGELIRDVVLEVDGFREQMSHEPSVIRAPNELRPLTAHEAWGCIGALTRAFLPVQSSLHRVSEDALVELKSFAVDLRKFAARLRKPSLGQMRRQDEVLAILCERRATRFDETCAKWEGKKEKEALVHLMGPCVACFELLFGTLATGGSDYKPSHFARFVTSFLTEMKVSEVSFQTVRRYFQRWQKLGQRAERRAVERTRSV